MLLRCCLIHTTIIILRYFLYLLYLLVSMSRLRSTFVVSMWSHFDFHLHYHYDICTWSFACFLEYVLLFRMMPGMKNVNNFPIVKVQPQSVAVLDFLRISVWRCLLECCLHKSAYTKSFSQKKKRSSNHCVKRVRIRSYSGPHFPAFELNTERYGVFSPNAGKCRPEWLRIRALFTQWPRSIFFPRNSLNMSHFHILCNNSCHMGQGFREWTKQSLWKTAFKKIGFA